MLVLAAFQKVFFEERRESRQRNPHRYSVTDQYFIHLIIKDNDLFVYYGLENF